LGPAHTSAAFRDGLEFGRQIGIADLLRVEIGDVDPHPVFHFEGADLVQERAPALELLEVLGHVLGEKDVAGVATIHHPLSDVDAAAGHVDALVHVHDAADRSVVNPHANGQPRVVLERAADLERTLGRLLRAPVEDQRHPVAGRDLQEPVGRLRFPKLLGQANDLVELIDPGVLLVRRELGVTDDVDEENVRDLELDLFLVVVRHDDSKASCSSKSPRPRRWDRRAVPRIMRQRFGAGQAGETAAVFT
jgi:hypothetical protein